VQRQPVGGAGGGLQAGGQRRVRRAPIQLSG
jgi:hypothetical protein